MKLSHLALVLPVATGCHDSSHHTNPDAPIVVPDAPPDSPSVGPNVVTIDTLGESPIYLAFRDGTGPWQKIDPASTQLHITEAYQLLAVCGDATNGFWIGFQGQTFSGDGDTIILPCASLDPGPGTPATVTGTMVQAGFANLGFFSKTSATPNWNFSFHVLTGTHDLVAFGNNRYLLRRDLDITASTAIPDVDTQAGADGTAVAVTINGGEADETLSSSISLFTANEFFFFPDGSPTMSVVVPDQLLLGTDSQRLRARASGATTFRSATEVYTTGAPTTFTLPPKLANITFDTGKASWTGALPDGSAELDVFPPSGASFATVAGSPSFLAATTSLVFDTNVPGFRPEWQLDASPPDLSFTVSSFANNISTLTEVFPPISVAATRHGAAPRNLDRRERAVAKRRR